jgi:hypothetical protein
MCFINLIEKLIFLITSRRRINTNHNDIILPL